MKARVLPACCGGRSAEATIEVMIHAVSVEQTFVEYVLLLRGLTLPDAVLALGAHSLEGRKQ